MEIINDKKERILSYATKRFMESGYSGVTTEEIARGCGVGKASVYKLFPSKYGLLLCCIERGSRNVEAELGVILADPLLPPDAKFDGVMRTVIKFLSHLSAPALEDVRRNAPEAYELLDTSRRRIIFENMTKIIADGKKSGVFRPDTEPAVVSHIAIGAVTHLAEPEVLSALDKTPSQLLSALISVLIDGCRVR